jgi:hypothetical protein
MKLNSVRMDADILGGRLVAMTPELSTVRWAHRVVDGSGSTSELDRFYPAGVIDTFVVERAVTRRPRWLV